MANYPIPPWIKPPQNLAADYAEGAQLGAKIGMERQKAQQEREMVAMESQVKAQQLQQKALQDQQELAVQKAYHDQQIALRQKQLDQAQQVVTQKTQAAARQFAAQQRFQQMVTSGMDPDKAALSIGPELFGNSMAGFAGVAKEVYQRSNPFVPTTKTVDGVKLVQESPNRWARVPMPSSVSGQPLQLSPILDPSGKTVPGAGAYTSGTGGSRPFIFPKVVDENKKAIKEMEAGPFGPYLTGERDLPKDKTLKARVEAVKKRYDELKRASAAPAAGGSGKQYRYNPATKKIEALVSPPHTEESDQADVADDEE